MSDEAQAVCVRTRPGGKWIKVVAEPRHLNPRRHGDHRTMWEALAELVPPGEFVVAMTNDLRFAGKPGNWHPRKD